jgi:serine/threonine protein kinase
MLIAQLAHDDLDMAVDDQDGLPVGRYDEGAELVEDCLAWDRLGVGQRCETWLAWSTRLWSPVVVKLPRPHQLDHPRARRSLGREVAALAANLHPGLPALYSDGTGAAAPYVVVEHVDGPALDDDVADRGPLAALDAAVLGWQLLAALRAVHARGLAHVDVKPENVVLRDGRPVLIDFGSARALGAAQPAGHLIGSAGYAAPDLEAGAPISAAMDVYGVGVTLHEALTGLPCFEPDRPARERPAPAALPESGLCDLIMAMLAPQPEGRPSVDVALADLAQVADAAGHPVGPPWLHAGAGSDAG